METLSENTINRQKATLVSGADLKERAKMHPSEIGPFVAQLRAGNSIN